MSEKGNWGYHIRLLREQRKLSRVGLAAASGIAYRTLDKIENGRQKKLSSEQVDGLSKALGVPVIQILDMVYNTGALPDQIPIYSKFPYEIGDEAMTSVTMPNMPSKNTTGFLVHGSYLEPKFHDGDYVFADDTIPLNGGDTVVFLLDGKMQFAKLRKVEDELWLEGKAFKSKFKDSQYVYKIIGHYTTYLHTASLAIVAGLVGMFGLLAGLVQLVT